mgnify:FL=1
MLKGFSTLFMKTLETSQILDKIPNSIFIIEVHDNSKFKINHVNEAQLTSINKKRSDIVGKFIHEILPERLANYTSSMYQQCVDKRERISYEEQVDLPDEGERYFLTTITPIEDEDNKITRLVGTSVEITEQKKSEQSLKESEEKYRGFVQNSSEGIYLFEFREPIDSSLPVDEQRELIFENGYISTCNLVMANMYGYNDIDSLIGKDLNALWGAIGEEENIEYLTNIIESGYDIKDELSVEVDKDGNPKYFLNSITGVVENGYLTRVWATQKDITSEKVSENKIQESLTEKNTLLSEIHHRVKNNLAVVSGMMQLQAFESDDDELKAKLYDSVVRIKTMATVHELLYQSQSFSQLEFSETLQKLVENISDTLQTSTPIETNIHCNPLKLNINQAIPASLIVNEVLTNIYKHAFDGHELGKIDFELTEENELISIKIEDNGIGFEPDFVEGESSSLGLHLIRLLSEQIDATYTYKNLEDKPGAYFEIQFKRSNEISGIGSANVN